MINTGVHLIILPLLILYFVFAGCGISQEKYNVLVITGGRKTETAQFLEMFRKMEGIRWQEAVQPDANDLYASPEIDTFDVLVFYDMTDEINEHQKQAFLNLLDRGKGMVFLHHSLVSYQEWDEFERIAGGRYVQSNGYGDTTGSLQSTYRHDVQIPVHIVDTNHPVTRGMKDFVLHDEIYGNYKILPSVTPLLKTSHPESEDIIGWAHTYGGSRIVYIQPGHDRPAFENSSYLRLIRQSIAWVAQK